ncbi:MAG: MFS transporter [Candidatus Latescibacterota bacterium]|nr:MFS transporter [Candidatus Latescibacterota bacterium]MEE3040937.1 MFS transporter [Candidatus Latescibacterota bacterium]
MAESVDTTRTLLTPLRRPDFIRLWMADGLWWQSMWMETLVTGWLALEMTDSAWWVSVVAFCRNIPVPLVGFLGPVWVERFRRRRVIQALQSVNLLAALTLAILYHFGRLEYWHLTMVSLANGAAWALDWPTRRALLPDLVGRDHVVDAMVLENVLQSLTRLSGPLLAGLAMQHLGAGGALWILCLIGGTGLLVLLGLRTDSHSPEQTAGIRDALARTREGLRYVRGNSAILGTLIITVIMNAWAFPFQALLPVFARDVLGQGPFGLGLLGAANGAGAMVGLLLVNLSRRSFGHPVIFSTGSILACVGLVAFSLSSSMTLSLAALAIAGVGQAGFSIMQSSIILVEATDQMRSRAMGALVIAIGVGPLGRVQAGAMAAAWSAPVAVFCMAASGALATLAVVLLLLGFVRRSQEPPDD